MKYFFISFALLFSMIISLAPSASKAFAANGTLVKGASSAAVYYIHLDKRYAFPNEKIFFSWFSDFSGVTQISDSELAALPLSGNVTYRPGSTLIKITTDPKVYALSRYGVLHWVTSEILAKSLYGDKWNKKIADVPDEFFTNYLVNADLTAANQFNPNEEQALTPNPGENIRPSSFVPPALPAPSQTLKTPKLSVTLSSNQAVMNQTIYVYANVTDNVSPIVKIVIRAEDSSEILATCLNAVTCEYPYQVQIAPMQKRFYAEATDNQGLTLTTLTENRPLLSVASSSDQLQMQINPATVIVGGRANFISDASKIPAIISHRVFAIISGEKYPVLWKDCEALTICTASTPFYRPTYLYSQVNFDGQTYQSASVLADVTGGPAPKPTIVLISKPAPNQVEITIKPPAGEMIGLTSLVEGSTLEDKALALCEANCSLTLQISKPTDLTAFTYVGGKYEKSNTLNVAP